jgi:NADH dehydrogenase
MSPASSPRGWQANRRQDSSAIAISLATIGRRAAVVDFGWLRLTGRLAWLVWGVAHIYFLIGFRNRMAVATDWLWSYLTYQRGARLITGHDNVTDAISIASKQ